MPPREPVEDPALVRRFCDDGDREAAAELLGKYERALYNYLWQMLRHTQDCEDAIQNTFAKALRALPRYREQSHFKSWLFRIGHNEAIDAIRRRKRTVADEAPEEHAAADPLARQVPTASEELERGERTDALREAVTKLPDAEREVLLLRLQGDVPFKEIAKVTGSPLGTVLARMHNAKKRLRPLLEPLLS